MTTSIIIPNPNPEEPEVIERLITSLGLLSGEIIALSLRKNDVCRSIRVWLAHENESISVSSLGRSIELMDKWIKDIDSVKERMGECLETLMDQPEWDHPTTEDLIDAGLIDKAVRDAEASLFIHDKNHDGRSEEDRL